MFPASLLPTMAASSWQEPYVLRALMHSLHAAVLTFLEDSHMAP